MRRGLRITRALVSAFLFAAALWILRDVLREYHYHEVVRDLRAIAPLRLATSFILTVLGYLALVGQDLVALRYIGRPLRTSRVAPIAFVGYAVSNSAPVSLLTGGGLRYRLYGGLGLTGLDTAKLVAFDASTYLAGLLTVAGIAFVAEPRPVPGMLRLPLATLHPVGFLFLALAGTYVLLSALRRRPIRIRSWEIHLPPARLALAQIGVSSLDWTISAAALYVLLPPGAAISYPQFVAVFLLAQIVTLIAPLPGGLGVFEAIIVLLVPAGTPGAAVLGSLLAYRVIYYLLPLLAAGGYLAVQLFRTRRFERAVSVVGRWAAAIAPDVLALLTFLAGFVMLLGSAVPLAAEWVAAVTRFLPLALLELAHLLGTATGVLLLFLAWGLGRRLRSAYHITVGLLVFGILLGLPRGFAHGQAAVLGILLLALLPARRLFYRSGPLTRGQLGAGWSVAVLLALLALAWLGLVVYQGQGRLWSALGRITAAGGLGRSLRAAVVAVITLIVVAAIRLLRVPPPKPVPPRPAELDRAATVVALSPRSSAGLVYLGDKTLLFSDDGAAFIMYAASGRTWAALGGAVGPAAERMELAWQFRELADREGAVPAFFDVAPSDRDLYEDLGLTLLELGDARRVPLTADTWGREGLAGHGPGESGGGDFEVLAGDDVVRMLPELERIATAWQARSGPRERGFCRAFFHAPYVARLPAAVLYRGARPVAFASLMTGAGREELGADLVRFVPGRGEEVLSELLVRIGRWGAAQGYRWLDLGLGPGLESPGVAHALVMSQLGALPYRYAEHFDDMRGLARFLDTFQPQRQTRCLAVPPGFALPRVLHDIAGMITAPAASGHL